MTQETELQTLKTDFLAGNINGLGVFWHEFFRIAHPSVNLNELNPQMTSGSTEEARVVNRAAMEAMHRQEGVFFPNEDNTPFQDFDGASMYGFTGLIGVYLDGDWYTQCRYPDQSNGPVVLFDEYWGKQGMPRSVLCRYSWRSNNV